jgi:putative transcriptional regulator
MKSLAGQLLVASQRLLDPNFLHTVLVIVQHNHEGALGLVLNRPLETTVKEASEQILGSECPAEGSLYQGGPCEGPLMVVHRHDDMKDATIFPGVYFTTERSKIEWLLQNELTGAKYFVGYSGWTAGQLEAEMETGTWLVSQPTPEQIFNDYEDLWQTVTTLIAMGKFVDPSRIPDDPSMN